MGKNTRQFFFSINLEYGTSSWNKLNQLMLDLTLSTTRP